MQNYPNPFNPETNLEFGISELGFVSLKVYDGMGREVQTLVNEKLSPGSYTVKFNGDGLASGIYFYSFKVNGFTETKRMILIK
ncbi:MAG: T9SS type A sorting domain-containing protein [Ignavibacteria bacterium]